MYVAGFVIPVPEANRDAYRRWTERSAALLAELGCMEIVDCWEDDVPTGQWTDFRKAVAAEPGEKIAFSWQVWPDRETVDAAEAVMRTDPRFEPAPGEAPFDTRRLIVGSFRPINVMGRG